MFTRKQLEEALEAQAVIGGRLGTILIEMGAIGELDLAEVLSEQLGVPFANPDQLVDIPEAALNALTPELAQIHQVLPLAFRSHYHRDQCWVAIFCRTVLSHFHLEKVNNSL